MSNLTNTSNLGDVIVYKTLQEWNKELANQRLPTIVFLCILIVIGIISNTVVILIYGLKYPASTFRLYILVLAFIDLFSCCLSMPTELVDNAYPVMFYSEDFCKAGRFSGNVLKIGSAFVLVVMAAGRYKKICRPFSKQTTLLQARLCCLSALILAVIFSWPNAIIQGMRYKDLPGNLTGYDCSIDDDIVKTKYPFIYSTVLFVVYGLSFIILCVLYTLVIISLQKHAKKQTQYKFNDKIKKTNPRITKLMIAITVAFILCHLPNCILDAVSTFKRGLVFPPSPLILALLPLLSRTFFINNVINPFIYLIGETKFRNICKNYLQWIYYSICRKREKVYLNNEQCEDLQLTDIKSSNSG